MDTVKRKAGKRAIRTVVPMLFLLLASCLHAQDRQYKFRLIDASDGLSDGQIRSLTMTEEGCIAIKTGFYSEHLQRCHVRPIPIRQDT